MLLKRHTFQPFINSKVIMKQNKSMPGPRFTPKRIRRSIKMDRIHPADFNSFQFVYHCEQCSHFSASLDQCSIGYNSELHKKNRQLESYYLHGHMALCRFQEID